MDLLVTIIMLICVTVNLVLTDREGSNERWIQIAFFPVNLSFSYLLAGYSIIKVLNMLSPVGYDSYRESIDMLFAVILVYYVVSLLTNRRKYM